MADTEVQSPTEAIHSYLRSKGLQPTAENVRRVLAQNLREPGTIPGLRNEAPPDENKQNTTPARNQSAAKRIERDTSLPLPPPAPPGETTGGTTASVAGSNDSGPSISLSNVIDPIAALLGLGGAGVGAKMLYNRFNRGKGAEYVGNTPPPFYNGGVDVNPQALPSSATQQMLNWERMGDPELAASPQGAANIQSPQDIAGPQVNPQITNQSTPSAIPMRDETSGPTIPMPDEASPIVMRNGALQDLPTATIQPNVGSVSGNNPIEFSDISHGVPAPARVGGAASEGSFLPFIEDIIKLISHARR